MTPEESRKLIATAVARGYRARGLKFVFCACGWPTMKERGVCGLCVEDREERAP